MHNAWKMRQMTLIKCDKLCLCILVILSVCCSIFDCSKGCECRFGDDQEVIIGVDCSNRDLAELPMLDVHNETAITHLDLSGNRLTNFPILSVEFYQITYLDLSKNDIVLTDEPVIVPVNLRVLHMGQNQISNWTVLGPTIQRLQTLVTLNVSENPLSTLSALQNPTLRTVDLSFCQITKINGRNLLQDLPQLDTLILRGNPLRSITDMISTTLTFLDLSNCKLSFLSPNVIEELPELTVLNLSHNPRLSLTRKSGEFVRSDSLKIVDLSYNNMDTIEISGFPNITTVNLRGNLITHLRREHFANTASIEIINLSNNAITHISTKALHGLVMLKHFDISFNMIRHLDSDTFKSNEQLTSINLSRNFIERLSRFHSQSLTHLDMSWCEVQTIDDDAFVDLPMLVRLDLSHNLLSEFPPTLRSQQLQSLNLSMCRLGTIRNDTFHGFPELTQLQLSGNRFTTPFHVDFFMENPYLRDIWLGDNPWRCDCKEPEFYKWFVHITQDPIKIKDSVHLHCFSPEQVYGLNWDMACNHIWHSTRSNKLAMHRVYSFLIVSIIVFVVTICIVTAVRRFIQNRKRERNEMERLENLDAARNVRRHNQSVLEQQTQLNAPDPRESHPPCYDDALLLPIFTGSFASLKGKWKKEEEDCVDSPITRRNRSHSEEILSPRESIIEQNRQLHRQHIVEAYQRVSIYAMPAIPSRPVESTQMDNNNDQPS